MTTSLRVLILEDRADHAELMARALKDNGLSPDWQRVETEEEFRAKLATGPDIILADYNLPRYSGLRALETVKELHLDIPCILVSGMIGEELAVACLKQGAVDYLLKDRLARLGSAVRQALEQKRLRKEKARAEAALQNNERRFRALVEHSGEGIATIDACGTILYSSPSTSRVLGYGVEEFVGTNLFATVHPEDRAELEEQLRLLAHEGSLARDVHLTCRLRHKDGSWRWSDLVATNLLPEPTVAGIVINYRDITERKRADAVRARLASLVESSDDAIMSLSADGTILTWNGGAISTFGWGSAECVGQSMAMLVPAERSNEIQEVLVRVARGEHVVHWHTVGVRKDGARIHVSATLSPIEGGRGVREVSVIARDVTILKQAEEALRTHALEQEVVAYISRWALDGMPLDALLQDCTALVARALGAEYCMILTFLPDQDALAVRASAGWDHVAGRPAVLAGAGSFADHVRSAGDPVVFTALGGDTRFAIPALLAERGITSGISVPIRRGTASHGMLAVLTTEPRTFTRDDIHFLQAVTNVLANLL
ncbi:MAG TPA: PAS domain S-box protein [bacterium]|nr:PAS domain S-box protein [bacterium]